MQSRRSNRRGFLSQATGLLVATQVPLGKAQTAVQAAPGDLSKPLEVRKEELRRRVASLPAELSGWRTRAKTELDMNLHLSQIVALDVLVGAFTEDQQAMVNALNPQGNESEFLKQTLDILAEIIRAQGVWEFYRQKYQMRLSPDFKGSLRVADLVAWDCYRPVIEAAARSRIIPSSRLREPPLCYYEVAFSPATWVRGSEPSDLRDRQGGTIRTPIPVIQLPWDYAENLWEFLSIPHEVGHDLEADLNLRSSLLRSLCRGGTPDARIGVWMTWLAETFADLIGLQLVGPAYLEALMHLLLLPIEHVITDDPLDPHPTPYIRVRMCAAYIRDLVRGDRPLDLRQREELSRHADQIERFWTTLYGNPAHLRDYPADFSHVFRALMDTPLPVLRDQTTRSLIPYTAEDDVAIRAASSYLETGQNRPASIGPRHCVAAARLSVTSCGRKGVDLAAKLRSINQRTAKLVGDNAPEGVLAGQGPEHREFIAGFAKRISVK